jgi:hypothetical protein
MAYSGDDQRQPLDLLLQRASGPGKELGSTVCSSSVGERGSNATWLRDWSAVCQVGRWRRAGARSAGGLYTWALGWGGCGQTAGYYDVRPTASAGVAHGRRERRAFLGVKHEGDRRLWPRGGGAGPARTPRCPHAPSTAQGASARVWRSGARPAAF